MISCACAVTLCAASQVGTSIAEVTVPTESVTVSQKEITVTEKNITRSVPDILSTQKEFFARVRNAAHEHERLSAFNEILDQELVFKLFFKPGEDRNIAIRKLALKNLAEIEVIKVIAEKIKVQELRDEAITRIKSIYADERDFKPISGSQVARLYAQRMRLSR